MPETEKSQANGWKIKIDSVKYSQSNGWEVMLENGEILEGYSSINMEGLNEMVTTVTLTIPLLRNAIKNEHTT